MRILRPLKANPMTACRSLIRSIRETYCTIVMVTVLGLQPEVSPEFSLTGLIGPKVPRIRRLEIHSFLRYPAGAKMLRRGVSA